MSKANIFFEGRTKRTTIPIKWTNKLITATSKEFCSQYFHPYSPSLCCFKPYHNQVFPYFLYFYYSHNFTVKLKILLTFVISLVIFPSSTITRSCISLSPCIKIARLGFKVGFLEREKLRPFKIPLFLSTFHFTA